jgi:hypothetical protein
MITDLSSSFLDDEELGSPMTKEQQLTRTRPKGIKEEKDGEEKEFGGQPMVINDSPTEKGARPTRTLTLLEVDVKHGNTIKFTRKGNVDNGDIADSTVDEHDPDQAQYSYEDNYDYLLGGIHEKETPSHLNLSYEDDENRSQLVSEFSFNLSPSTPLHKEHKDVDFSIAATANLGPQPQQQQQSNDSSRPASGHVTSRSTHSNQGNRHNSINPTQDKTNVTLHLLQPSQNQPQQSIGQVSSEVESPISPTRPKTSKAKASTRSSFISSTGSSKKKYK